MQMRALDADAGIGRGCGHRELIGDIGSSSELTDADNKSEHTTLFSLQDVPGLPVTDPSTRDRSCFKIFHVFDINVVVDY